MFFALIDGKIIILKIKNLVFRKILQKLIVNSDFVFSRRRITLNDSITKIVQDFIGQSEVIEVRIETKNKWNGILKVSIKTLQAIPERIEILNFLDVKQKTFKFLSNLKDLIISCYVLKMNLSLLSYDPDE